MNPNEEESASETNPTSSDQPSVDVNSLMSTLQGLPSQVSLLLEEINRLRTENAQQKIELDQMSFTLKTTLALKNRKIKDLESALTEKKNGASEGSGGDMQPTVSKAGKGKTTIRARFAGISKLGNEMEERHAIPVKIDDVQWTLKLFANFEHLSVLLTGKNAAEGVLPPHGTIEFHVLRQANVALGSHSKTYQSSTFEGKLIYGDLWHMKLEDLFDAEKGLVKDDSIIVDVVFLPAANLVPFSFLAPKTPPSTFTFKFGKN